MAHKGVEYHQYPCDLPDLQHVPLVFPQVVQEKDWLSRVKILIIKKRPEVLKLNSAFPFLNLIF
jgi:hypothetical protein